MTTYMVYDTFTGEPFPADTLQDVQAAVEYILSGEELIPREQARLDEFLFEVAEQGGAFSQMLGLEVVNQHE